MIFVLIIHFSKCLTKLKIKIYIYEFIYTAYVSWQYEGFAQLGMLLANVERTYLLLTAIHILLDDKVDAETFTLGYITGSKRRPKDLEYQRPGFQISGAITLAVEEASNHLHYFTTVIYCRRPRLVAEVYN